jgi:hypothetical protein
MRFLAGALALVVASVFMAGGWLEAQTQKKSSPGTPPASNKGTSVPAEAPPVATIGSGFEERLTYAVEWRLIHAGTVVMEKRKGRHTLHLETAGIVSSLFKVNDVYTVDNEDSFCATSSVMDSVEGKKHRETRVTYDRAHNHASFFERDLLDNKVLKETGTAIPNCVSDVIGGIAKLRTMNVAPGQNAQLPISDGQRFADVKVQAQQREEIKIDGNSYPAIRYNADLMNGVVYPRKGQVLIWLSDDTRRLPVQIQLKTGFPVGTVTLQLEREERP